MTNTNSMLITLDRVIGDSLFTVEPDFKIRDVLVHSSKVPSLQVLYNIHMHLF